MLDLMQVAHFAQWVHREDTRKYTGTPYIQHPGRVAARLMLLPETTPELVAAGWLHDSYEDHPDICPIGLIEVLFGREVKNLVVEVTNVYTKHKRPDLPRATRKKLECQRLGGATRFAKLLKLADRLDNLNELDHIQDPGFTRLYVGETIELYAALQDCQHPMLEELRRSITKHQDVLSQKAI